LFSLSTGGTSGRFDEIETLTGAGATFPSVLYNRWLVVYHDYHSKVAITYAVVGSGEGVRRFMGKILPIKKRLILVPRSKIRKASS